VTNPSTDQTTPPDVTPLPQRGWTPALKARFLDRLAAHGNVRAACRAVNLSHEAAYRLRRRDADFARGWAAAVVLARENGAQVLAERAIDGVEEDVWYRGELKGTRRRYDARLLLAHLARLDRVADDEVARDDADRFDEVLARIAGEEPLASVEAWDDGLLPPCRVAHGDVAAEAAGQAVVAAWEAAEPGRALDEARSAELDAECDAAEAQARAAAESEWDGWFARACATVDAHAGWPDAPPVPGLPGNPLAPGERRPSTGSGPTDPEFEGAPHILGSSKGRPEPVEGCERNATPGSGRLPFSPPWTASQASTSALARALAGPVRSWPGLDLPPRGRRSLRRTAIDLRGSAA